MVVLARWRGTMWPCSCWEAWRYSYMASRCDFTLDLTTFFSISNAFKWYGP